MHLLVLAVCFIAAVEAAGSYSTAWQAIESSSQFSQAAQAIRGGLHASLDDAELQAVVLIPDDSAFASVALDYPAGLPAQQFQRFSSVFYYVIPFTTSNPLLSLPATGASYNTSLAGLANTTTTLTFIPADGSQAIVGGVPPGGVIDLSQPISAGKATIYAISQGLVVLPSKELPVHQPMALTLLEALQALPAPPLLLNIIEADPKIRSLFSNPDLMGTAFMPNEEALTALSKALFVSDPSVFVGTDLLQKGILGHFIPGRALTSRLLSVGTQLFLNSNNNTGVANITVAPGLDGLPNITVARVNTSFAPARVTQKDIIAGKAILHVIDGVLVPLLLETAAQLPPSLITNLSAPPPPSPSGTVSAVYVAPTTTTTTGRAPSTAAEPGSSGSGSTRLGKIVVPIVASITGFLLLAFLVALGLMILSWHRRQRARPFSYTSDPPRKRRRAETPLLSPGRPTTLQESTFLPPAVYLQCDDTERIVTIGEVSSSEEEAFLAPSPPALVALQLFDRQNEPGTEEGTTIRYTAGYESDLALETPATISRVATAPTPLSPMDDRLSNAEGMDWKSGSRTPPRLGQARAELQALQLAQRLMQGRMLIPFTALGLGRALGSGTTGTVYKAMWQGNAVAVKMLKHASLSRAARQLLKSDLQTMFERPHPCITHVYGMVEDSEHLAIVTRYYRGGSMADALAKTKLASSSICVKLRVLVQIANGVNCLHERNMLHGDLKSSNVLIHDDGHSVVITDFGLARPSGQLVQSSVASVAITPPEILQDPAAPRTPAGDIYSFAIVMLEIVSGRMVYQSMQRDAIVEAVMAGQRPDIPPTVPGNIAELIRGCWTQEAASRPTIRQVLESLDAAVMAHGCKPGPTTATKQDSQTLTLSPSSWSFGSSLRSKFSPR